MRMKNIFKKLRSYTDTQPRLALRFRIPILDPEDGDEHTRTAKREYLVLLALKILLMLPQEKKLYVSKTVKARERCVYILQIFNV